jgi:putative peptide zinc metalloprotease protein
VTLQLRPTFSESWYRVADLRVKLRASAQRSRQYYRGDRWYVVRDPAGNQFHRLSDPAYRFVGLLDGSRTVSQAWDLAGGQLADDAPTQPEVIQILSHLYSANLIDADVTPDATVLLRRHKTQQKRKWKGRMMNLLFPRIPLWDPDRFLVRWMPVVRPMFSRIGAIIWLLVILGAVATLAPEWGRIKEATANSIAPHNWIWLWGVFVFVKLIHELGHAFACRRFGGECHEMGIMFLIFIPTPYVDASTAWSFPNKWHRVFVGAAGMIVELFFAALCAFAWLRMDPNSLPTQLAFNAMLVASVSTVIFNANPLLRYDGYYILSDFLEIPNLRQKSSEYTLGLIKRHVFRVKAHQPLPPPGQRVWLFFYHITSTIYRLFVGFMIMLLVTFQIPVLGILMGIGGLITWAVVPISKLFKYLTLDAELHRKRGRAWAFTLAVAAGVVTLIGLIPFWVNIDQTGIVQAVPDARRVLHFEGSGFVREIRVKDGQHVNAGDVILVCDSPELNALIQQNRARLEELEARKRQALASDPADYEIVRKEEAAIRGQLRDAEEKLAKLTLYAPISGELVAPRLRDMPGMHLPKGTEVATVANVDRLLVRVALEQRDAEPVLKQVDPHTEVRMAGDVLTVLPATHVRLLPAAQEELPSSVLSHMGSENIAVDPRDPTGKKPMIRQWEAQVSVDNPHRPGHPDEPLYRPGQRAYVRFRLDKKPLIWQWGRRFWQLIQTESSSAKWI